MSGLFERYRNGMARRYKEYCWKNNIKKAIEKEKNYPVKEEVVVFDTAIQSLNMGDVIIQHYCRKVLNEIFKDKETLRVPTHVLPEQRELNAIIGAKNKIVCGTNLITPHFEENTNWKMPEDLLGYSNIVTLGVGWGYYCEDISKTSRLVYNTILSSQVLHSVRDSYTEKKFRQMGINNVVNTGCPTLWALNKEHCGCIPQKKAKNVITTVTDYDRNIDLDRLMLEILLEEYENVSVWIQGKDDFEYLKTLIDIDKVEIIPNKFESYTEVLQREDVDYIGTRLHAGIHALNQGVRSLIIAIDNRAIEMGKDVNLAMILREDIAKDLRTMVNKKWKTELNLPIEMISRWKKQFEEY